MPTREILVPQQPDLAASYALTHHARVMQRPPHERLQSLIDVVGESNPDTSPLEAMLGLVANEATGVAVEYTAPAGTEVEPVVPAQTLRDEALTRLTQLKEDPATSPQEMDAVAKHYAKRILQERGAVVAEQAAAAEVPEAPAPEQSVPVDPPTEVLQAVPAQPAPAQKATPKPKTTAKPKAASKTKLPITPVVTPLIVEAAPVQESQPQQVVAAEPTITKDPVTVEGEIYRPTVEKLVEKPLKVSQHRNREAKARFDAANAFVDEIMTSMVINLEQVRGNKKLSVTVKKARMAEINTMYKLIEDFRQALDEPTGVYGMLEWVDGQGMLHDETFIKLAHHYRRTYFSAVYEDEEIDQLSAMMAYWVLDKDSCDPKFRASQLKSAKIPKQRGEK